MALTRFFDSFPTIEYDMYRNKETKEVVDILRRVRVREDYKNLVAAYSSGDVAGGERPEIIASTFYGRPELHYMVMMINGVVDPYYDWVMDDKSLENYIQAKYTNRTLLLDDSTRSLNDFFLINETITGSSSSATGTVVAHDLTLKQLTYKLTSSDNFTDADTLTGGTSAVTIEVSGTPTYEWDGVHHYEIQQEQAGGITNRYRTDSSSATMKLVDNLNNNAVTLYNSVAVTNFDYEVSLNEEKRKIQILQGQFVEQFEQEFKDLIQR